MLGRKREVTKLFAERIVRFKNTNTRVLGDLPPKLETFKKTPDGFLTKIKDLRSKEVSANRIMKLFKRDELFEAYKEMGLSKGEDLTKALLIKHIIENL